jgi:hypothetical protein
VQVTTDELAAFRELLKIVTELQEIVGVNNDRIGILEKQVEEIREGSMLGVIH